VTAGTQPGGSYALVAGIEERMSATERWLATAPATTHTIQLLGVSNEGELRRELKALSVSLEPGNIHVFRTIAQGRPSLSVVYGAYPDRRAALQALENLPPSFAANKPVLRTVGGIRKELTHHNLRQP
jgi:septal ring-binding cell division protein DamX